jgi:hypothetical protein
VRRLDERGRGYSGEFLVFVFGFIEEEFFLEMFVLVIF